MTKYRAQPVTIDGIRFASKREGNRYAELKLLVTANEIEALELQPSFNIEIGGVKVCRYVADFAYTDRTTGERIVEDVKSPPVRKNRAYRLKWKLMKAVHGIEVLET